SPDAPQETSPAPHRRRLPCPAAGGRSEAGPAAHRQRNPPTRSCRLYAKSVLAWLPLWVISFFLKRAIVRQLGEMRQTPAWAPGVEAQRGRWPGTVENRLEATKGRLNRMNTDHLARLYDNLSPIRLGNYGLALFACEVEFPAKKWNFPRNSVDMIRHKS